MADIIRADPARAAQERLWAIKVRDEYLLREEARSLRPPAVNTAAAPKIKKQKKKQGKPKGTPPAAPQPLAPAVQEAAERQRFLEALFRAGSTIAPQVRP